VIDPAALQIMLGVLIGWLDRREREAVAYLIEENRLLRHQLGTRRLRFTDDDRRRLAAGLTGWVVRFCAKSPRSRRRTRCWYYTVFVIDLASRRVQVLGSTPIRRNYSWARWCVS
jgi:hypothetical protein